MLIPGNIIYFDPFYFKNGNKAKPKYFLVLSANATDTVIASLPTSVDYVPSNIRQESGCLEIPTANFNCFILTNSIEVTLCGKSFNVKTFLYGHLLDIYSKESLYSLYPNDGIDYSVWGMMKEDLFSKVIDCFMSSDSVKMKYKKMIDKKD